MAINQPKTREERNADRQLEKELADFKSMLESKANKNSAFDLFMNVVVFFGLTALASIISMIALDLIAICANSLIVHAKELINLL